MATEFNHVNLANFDFSTLWNIINSFSHFARSLVPVTCVIFITTHSNVAYMHTSTLSALSVRQTTCQIFRLSSGLRSPASYSGGPAFETQPGGRLYWLNVFVWWDNAFKQDTTAYPGIHSISFSTNHTFQLTLHNLRSWYSVVKQIKNKSIFLLLWPYFKLETQISISFFLYLGGWTVVVCIEHTRACVGRCSGET
jgi:hypothetical protein